MNHELEKEGVHTRMCWEWSGQKAEPPVLKLTVLISKAQLILNKMNKDHADTTTVTCVLCRVSTTTTQSLNQLRTQTRTSLQDAITQG